MTTTADRRPAPVRDYYAVFDGPQGVAAFRRAVAPDWRNHSSAGESTGVEEFLGLIAGLHTAVPDLAWRVEEVLECGDRLVVRGEGTGTPVAPLFGAGPTGRSFRILSIDIHTVRDGRIASSIHLEDWSAAIRQITA